MTTYRIKNRTNIVQVLRNSIGETVQVQPKSTVRVDKSYFFQRPDSKLFLVLDYPKKENPPESEKKVDKPKLNYLENLQDFSANNSDE